MSAGASEPMRQRPAFEEIDPALSPFGDDLGLGTTFRGSVRIDRPFAVTHDLSSECDAIRNVLEGDFRGIRATRPGRGFIRPHGAAPAKNVPRFFLGEP